jgi:3-hydroxyisobutyrate dehydrogenase-like beta-hydroxyacid dehydrogenase
MAMKSIESVGLLGLGKMGNPMARHLVARKFKVVGYDPVAAAREAAKSLGARIAGSPREVAQAAELVIVVVGFESEVEKAVFGEDGLLSAGKSGLIVALASTVAPQYAKRLDARLKERQVTLLDIPLARGEPAAEAGKLLIYGGGDEVAFEACRPALSAFASDIFHLGIAGAGQVGKLVNNLLLWACTAANDEGLRLGEALGVDIEKLRAALHHGSGQNWSLDSGAGSRPMPWAEKDMSIVLHEADLARLSLPLCGTVKEVIKGLKIRKGYPTPKEPE